MKVPKPRRMSSGRWYINMRLGGQSYNVTESTAKRCIHAAELIKAEYLNGKRQAKPEPEKPAPTVGELVTTYIDSRSNVLSPSSIRGYRIIRRTRFPELMQQPVTAVTPEAAQKAVNLEATRCATKTVVCAWALVAKALAEHTGTRISVNLPKIVRHERPFLSPDQIDAFVEAVHGTSMEIPALLGLCSLRCSEILGLRWEDVDLEHQRIHVRGATVPNERNQFVRKETAKNESSIRTVPIMPQLVEALKAAPRTGEIVVPYTESWMYRAINSICEEHGLPLIGVHGLRHSFASLAYHLGMPEHIAMQIGGWKDETTIRKIYRHIADSDVEESINEMQKYYAETEKRKAKSKPSEKSG